MGVEDLFSDIGLYKKPPTRNIVPLDPSTSGLIDDTVNHLNVPLSQTQSEMQGPMLQNAESTFQNPFQSDAQHAASGNTPYMADAIKDKYFSMGHEDLNRIKTQADYQGMIAQGNRLKSAWQLAMAKNNVMIDNLQKQAEANIQAEQLRAQFLSSVFKTAGSAAVMGFYGKRMGGGAGGFPGGNLSDNFSGSDQFDYGIKDPMGYFNLNGAGYGPGGNGPGR